MEQGADPIPVPMGPKAWNAAPPAQHPKSIHRSSPTPPNHGPHPLQPQHLCMHQGALLLVAPAPKEAFNSFCLTRGDPLDAPAVPWCTGWAVLLLVPRGEMELQPPTLLLLLGLGLGPVALPSHQDLPTRMPRRKGLAAAPSCQLQRRRRGARGLSPAPTATHPSPERPKQHRKKGKILQGCFLKALGKKCCVTRGKAKTNRPWQPDAAPGQGAQTAPAGCGMRTSRQGRGSCSRPRAERPQPNPAPGEGQPGGPSAKGPCHWYGGERGWDPALGELEQPHRGAPGDLRGDTGPGHLAGCPVVGAAPPVLGTWSQSQPMGWGRGQRGHPEPQMGQISAPRSGSVRSAKPHKQLRGAAHDPQTLPEHHGGGRGSRSTQ